MSTAPNNRLSQSSASLPSAHPSQSSASLPSAHPSQSLTSSQPSGCLTALFFILFGLGFILYLVGYITGNPFLNTALIPFLVFVVALLAVSTFETVINEGLKHGHKFFTTMWTSLCKFARLFLNPIVAYALTALIVFIVVLNPLLFTLEFKASTCVQAPFRFLCGNGITVTPYPSQDGANINIGLIDETVHQPFDPSGVTNGFETNLENLIFSENRQAEAGPHITLALVTTLSRTVTDPKLSASVGLEDLRGAYLAQLNYNHEYRVRLCLIIGNLGTKSEATHTAPLVAAQLVLYAANSSSTTHFMGVVGFPFSASTLQGLPRLQASHIPVISPSASSDNLSNQPYFYRVVSPDQLESNDIVDFITKQMKPKSVVVLYDGTDAYSGTLGGDVYDGLNRCNCGMTVSSDNTYRVSHPDTLNQPLMNIIANPPTLLFFAGYADDLNALKDKLKALRGGSEVANHLLIMGGEAFYELGGYTGDNYADIIFTTYAFPDTLNDKAQIHFQCKDPKALSIFQCEYASVFDPDNQYPGQYGYSRPGPHSVLTFDAINAYLNAFQSVPGNNDEIPSPGQLQNALMTISFPGVSGQISFNGTNAITPSDPLNKPVYIVCVDNSHLTHELYGYNINLSSRSQISLSQCLPKAFLTQGT